MKNTSIFNFSIAMTYLVICPGFYLADAHRQIQSNRPVIGVLAQSSRSKPFENLGKSFIVASYVKFLESSGARVVPIRNNLSQEEIKKLFQVINGAILPGGNVSLFNSGYANTSKTIFNLAKKTFDEGGYFPIMGMCLGHQFLATVVNGQTKILIHTDTYNITAPLNLLKDYRKSKLFRNIPEYLVNSFNKTPTAHFHEDSLSSELFQENKKLQEFYKVIATNVDRSGKEFVSVMEAKKYPFYSMQWHPEKCPFEWALKRSIPHDLTSIKLSQYISNFFVQEARFSSHKFMSEKDEREALIYNYQTLYTGKDGYSTSEQVYVL